MEFLSGGRGVIAGCCLRFWRRRWNGRHCVGLEYKYKLWIYTLQLLFLNLICESFFFCCETRVIRWPSFLHEWQEPVCPTDQRLALLRHWAASDLRMVKVQRAKINPLSDQCLMVCEFQQSCFCSSQICACQYPSLCSSPTQIFQRQPDIGVKRLIWPRRFLLLLLVFQFNQYLPQTTIFISSGAIYSCPRPKRHSIFRVPTTNLLQWMTIPLTRSSWAKMTKTKTKKPRSGWTLILEKEAAREVLNRLVSEIGKKEEELPISRNLWKHCRILSTSWYAHGE